MKNLPNLLSGWMYIFVVLLESEVLPLSHVPCSVKQAFFHDCSVFSSPSFFHPLVLFLQFDSVTLPPPCFTVEKHVILMLCSVHTSYIAVSMQAESFCILFRAIRVKRLEYKMQETL